MFGYRLLRETDYQALQDELKALRDVRITLLEKMTALEADARSKATLADLLIQQRNLESRELASYRHKLTGVPQEVARIGQGHPLAHDALAGGVDPFEDVGDEQADKLQRLGLLHDQESMLPFPGARELTSGLEPSTSPPD